MRVKNNAKYDIKTRDSWDNIISEVYSDIPFIHAAFPFVFDGKEINAEIFGNILFGHIGNAGGFTCLELIAGGSAYSLITTCKFDNEEDRNAVRDGFNLYEIVKRDYYYIHE